MSEVKGSYVVLVYGKETEVRLANAIRHRAKLTQDKPHLGLEECVLMAVEYFMQDEEQKMPKLLDDFKNNRIDKVRVNCLLIELK